MNYLLDMLEQEVIANFQQLNPSARQRVLDFLSQLERDRPVSTIELMQLPPEERVNQT